MKLSAIKSNPRNPRTIRDEKFDRLKKSLESFPQMMELRPIVVDENGVILGGNMRYQALKALGKSEIPDEWVKRADELTEEQKREFIIKDNVGFGAWDWDLIANEWDDLPLADWGLDVPTFETVETQPLEEDEDEVAETISKAKELQAKWNTATGQLWKLGEHRLLCGDSTKREDVEKLFGQDIFDTVFFDPPFDADTAVLKNRWICRDLLLFSDSRHLLDCVENWNLPFRNIFTWDGVTSWYVKGQPLARAKYCMWFGESDYNENGAHYGEPDKEKTVSNSRGTYQYKPDPRGKHLSTVYQSPNTRQFDGHAHTKPVEWVKMLIANCSNGNVFDPFAGAGSSIVACESLKRVCFGVELEANNVAVILERLQNLGVTPELIEG